MLLRVYWRILDRLELHKARRAYEAASAACSKVTGRDDVPPGLWEALDDVRRAFGEHLIDAEVSYLRGVM